MADERRYRDDEVAQIFEAASAPVASRAESAPGQGLTLAELQDIGREVGIAPERIAEAASSLARVQPPLARRTELGMPVTAGLVVDLPRALTDREWALVVADLRETFGARGKESSQGETRQWTNNNLHAFVEPTRTGYRLRLGTLKGDALALNRMGGFGIAVGAIVAATPLFAGSPAGALPGAVMLGAMGIGAIAFNALRLGPWARTREEQMKAIADRTRELLGTGTDGEKVP
ncbi:MAG TPA: hypothetical protein VM076_24060 [Gemmatimonadaceae bacterium]|nr:hypothetical protein [Gemmatimonadaceae bacterium]